MKAQKLLDLFESLQKSERLLDEAVKKKKMLVEEAHFKGTRKVVVLKLYITMMRREKSGIFMTIGGNVVDERPLQKEEGRQEEAGSVKSQRTFGSTIKKICVDLMDKGPSGAAPESANDLGYLLLSSAENGGEGFGEGLVQRLEKHGRGEEQESFFEWVNREKCSEVREFELKTQFPCVRGRVFVEFMNYEGKYSLCPELAEILGLKAETKSSVLISLWKYVKANRLQDQKRNQIIVCNEPLRSLFKKDELTFKEITESLHTFMCPIDMLSIPFEVPEAFDVKHQDAYEITFEVDDLEKGYAYLESEKVAVLDKKISDILLRIRRQDEKIEALDRFTKDPKRFVTDWILEHSKSLHIIADDLYDVDSDFYRQKEVQESVYQLLQNYK
jgi:SWIB/MDM2 domain